MGNACISDSSRESRRSGNFHMSGIIKGCEDINNIEKDDIIDDKKRDEKEKDTKIDIKSNQTGKKRQENSPPPSPMIENSSEKKYINIAGETKRSQSEFQNINEINNNIDAGKNNLNSYVLKSDINLINKSNDLNSQNTPSKEEKENKNYEQFDINKDYYLTCPDCNNINNNYFIQEIDSIDYISDEKDFKLIYKCFCELNDSNKKEKYLYELITEMPKCDVHDNENLIFFCNDCNTKFCLVCKKNNNHRLHNISIIIKEDIISDEIMNKILEQKDNFKGFDIFEKIYKLYHTQINLDDENSDNPGETQEKKEEQENDENKSGLNKGININENNTNNINKIIHSNSMKENNINEDENTKNKQENKFNNDNNNTENQVPIEKNPFLNNNENQNMNNNGNQNMNNDSQNMNNNESQNQFMINENQPEIEKNPSINNSKINEIAQNENEKKGPETNEVNNNGFNEENKDNFLPSNNLPTEKDIKFPEPNPTKVMSSSNNGEILPNIEIMSVNININSQNQNTNDLILGNKNDNNNNINNINDISSNNNNNNIENDNANQSKIDNITDINQNDQIDNQPTYLKEYENTKTIKGHERRISSLIALESGYIATGSYDSSIKIWDITKEGDQALIKVKYSVGYVLCLLEFKRDELIIGNSENCIDIFDLNDGKEDAIVARYVEHKLYVNALVKCDDTHFASASNDATIIIWEYNDRPGNIKKQSVLEGHSDCILTMILLSDGRLCSGSADHDIRIWDWKNSSCTNYFRAHDNWIKYLLQFDDKILLSSSDDKAIKIWDENYNEIGKFEGHEAAVRTLCKIDDNYFASGGFDNKIKIWDFKNKKCVQTLEGHMSNVLCIIKYNDKLISSSCDRTIKIWEQKNNDNNSI